MLVWGKCHAAAAVVVVALIDVYFDSAREQQRQMIAVLGAISRFASKNRETHQPFCHHRRRPPPSAYFTFN